MSSKKQKSQSEIEHGILVATVAEILRKALVDFGENATEMAALTGINTTQSAPVMLGVIEDAMKLVRKYIKNNLPEGAKVPEKTDLGFASNNHTDADEDTS